MATIAEQIASLEAKRAANVARMESVLQKAIDDGRTTEAGEQEEHDTLSQEVEQIDGDLVRLKKLQAIKVSGAKPVAGVVTVERAADTRDPASPSVILQRREELAKGIRFARYAKAMGCSYLSMRSGNFRPAYDFAKSMYPRDVDLHEIFEKANVTAGGTNSTHHWGSQLVGTETSAFADFAEYLRPQTIIGKFGQNGVPALRQVPFRTALVGQTSGGSGYWVGESQAKPLTSFAFTRTSLTPLKVANIAVTTMELLRDSSPSAEAIVRDSLAGALRERMDIDFIDPAKAVSAGVSPASITNGISQTASLGNQAYSIRQDVRGLINSFVTANNPPTNGVWIMKSTTALALSMLVNGLSTQPEFPGISLSGGTFFGMPVIVSEHVPDDTYGTFVVLVNASDIYFADEGEVAVDMSQEASLQMLDNPTNASDSPPVATSVVSLWQTNSVGFRAERTLNWARRRTEGVAVLDGVHWGEPGSP
jgi:predicted phage gp36 major capsid-like protein